MSSDTEEPGTRIAGLSISLDRLLSDEFRMYLCSLMVSQRAPLRSAVAHVHIVFAQRQHWKFCEAEMRPLNPRSNPLLYRAATGQFCSVCLSVCVCVCVCAGVFCEWLAS